MCCDGCAGKLYGSVVKVDGVADAAIDPVLGRAEILADASTDVAALTAALSFGKYEAVPTE